MVENPFPDTAGAGRPRLLPRLPEEPTDGVDVAAVPNPVPESTLGDAGLGARLRGPARVARAFLAAGAPAPRQVADESLLILPIGPQTLAGLDADTVRVFRVDAGSGEYRPVWNSGVNKEMDFVWAKVRGEGTYVPLGLPRDPILRDALHRFSVRRRFDDLDDDDSVRELFEAELGPFLDEEDEELTEARTLVARLEWTAGARDLRPDEVRRGDGGHPAPFPLPGDAAPDQFRERLRNVVITARGLPEEVLFDPPDVGRPEVGQPLARTGMARVVERARSRLPRDVRALARLQDDDWWMYQGDEAHTGAVRGPSGITSTTVGRMTLFRKVSVTGPVNSIPVVADGKVYVGTTWFRSTGGGTLYKIDLSTGTVEATFTPPGTAFYPISGIGSSPAVVGGRVYISTVYGRVFCLDAGNLGLIWMQDLKVADAARRQPVNNPEGDCWASPLVVNDRVYVASGEGESANPFGFVWCLDAATGLVVWVYCTCKFENPTAAGNENRPNVLPRSAAISDPLPAWATAAGFSLHDDPPHKGAAPWSSCAYDRVLNRIYIGTGNSRPDNPLPDDRYASGVIALDATTGEFRGFHQPLQSDSYRPNDKDVDVPCPPTVFERDGTRVVAYGSKNGSFFLCDADTMQVLPNGRRQLLPKDEVTGGRIHTVDPTGGVSPNIAAQDSWAGENKWGVMASAAVDRDRGHLYVGLGGYSGLDDPAVTPFVRALDWNDLSDAWPTTVQSVTRDGITYSVRKYANATPPVYTSREAGLGSPAVCNDVVFVPSHRIGLYAMDADTGLALWSAPGLPAGGWPNYCLGPAVYGDHVVVGAGEGVYLYRLEPTRPPVPPLDRTTTPVPQELTPPTPPPGPLPDLLSAVREVVRQELAARDVLEREERR